jgi:hypothetical protein
MDRELSYQMPFERLLKLSRSAGRKAYAVTWVGRWLLLGLLFAAIALLIVFEGPVQEWQASVGIPWFSAFLAIAVGFFVFVWVLRQHALRQMKSRADYQSTVRMRQDDGGIHFATDEVEYYLRWKGISQLLMEHDGVAVSHGNLFFLVPDRAFADLEERNSFIRNVFGRLGAEAQARSKRHIGSVLADAAEA